MKLEKRIVLPAMVSGLLLLALLAAWCYHRRETAASELTLYGNVDIRQVDLAFDGSARITKMVAVEGQAVHKGDLLGQLDTTRFEQAAAEAKAQVAAQQQVVARMRAGSRPEEIRKAQADVDAAQAQLTYAQQQYDRTRNLATQDIISKSRLDNAKAQYDAAAAQLNAMQQALALAQAGPRKEDVAAAKATLEALQAQWKLAEQNLADASLYAPDDGIIQTRILEPGDMASPQRPAYTLALSNPVWVRAYVSEDDLGRIHGGMTARVSSDSYPGKHYDGWIGYISPTAEFTPKTVETTELRSSLVYEVRVYVCNPQNELRLGMPVTVDIALENPAPAAATGCPPAR